MITNLLTVEKAAEVLGVSVSFVYKLVRTRQLAAVKIGTSVRIRPEDLDEFVKINLTIMGREMPSEEDSLPPYD